MSKVTNGSNLMWEASRVILPEHRAAIFKYNQEQKNQNRPHLDEQQVEELNYLIQESLNSGRLVRVTVFGEYGNSTAKCIIKRIDKDKGRILVSSGGDQMYISFTDILSIE